jgi:MerR family redox-sensitive transcriptional activator SoxR
MDQMTIGEVAGKANVHPSTLRYYESIGLLQPAMRIRGQRRYKPDVLERLQVIQYAKEAGFTLAEIKTLVCGFSESKPPSEKWKVMAEKKILEVDAQIEKAQGMKRMLQEGLQCECLSIDECVVFLNG